MAENMGTKIAAQVTVRNERKCIFGKSLQQ